MKLKHYVVTIMLVTAVSLISLTSVNLYNKAQKDNKETTKSIYKAYVPNIKGKDSNIQIGTIPKSDDSAREVSPDADDNSKDKTAKDKEQPKVLQPLPVPDVNSGGEVIDLPTPSSSSNVTVEPLC
ncbi:hypothetical protein CDLVIII_4340 [Clostridium sp. DL-VIII]|uniref:hypothetical protein n=1 Tax=Clostridium sp. DL-VIII TaxID=641107 RepID=UPI00023B0593|nr:hypothetical protein [Clostridium sp. DL-VIII]EHJ00854.1 hypothetical protein CDLVIII_4340 [Clostridium sp. DL-VIII]